MKTAKGGVVTIGCAGFPVPATRYFKEFPFVEIQETHVSTPGQGTVRRWRREAPKDFTFAVLAAREIGQEAYRDGTLTQSKLDELEGVAKELDAKLAVFTCPPDLAPSRPNKAAIQELLAVAKQRFAGVVFEPPVAWEPGEAEALCVDAKVIPARDPLAHGLFDPKKVKIAYYRMPGPAGHKSRYEDHAIEKLGDLARSAKHDEVYWIFTNVDMAQDAKRLKKALASG